MKPRVLHLDSNHSILAEELESLGFLNEYDYTSSREEIMKRIQEYEGLIIRSRFPIDQEFLKAAGSLKFIGRVGAGLENIDTAFAESLGICLINAPEGNRTAVGEHALGMLLMLMNHLIRADREVRSGIWRREENRGFELEGKTVGIYGYGHMGKAFAQRLKGFGVEVICYDIKENVGDANAVQVDLAEFRRSVDIVSLHTPQTPDTFGLVNSLFIEAIKKPFWFVNTARGKSVVTADLVNALKSGKVLGAALDVLEYEKSSFENLFSSDEELPEPMKYLIQSDKVVLSPHIGGWTHESKEKLARVVAGKIANLLHNRAL